jgi:hypothetical protein
MLLTGVLGGALGSLLFLLGLRRASASTGLLRPPGTLL